MRKLLALIVTITFPLIAGCAVHSDTQPSPSGPAESSLSIKLLAVPDHLVQDGSQSARISITAFDAGGHAIAAQVKLALQPAGFGTLSFDNVSTSTDVSHPTS